MGNPNDFITYNLIVESIDFKNEKMENNKFDSYYYYVTWNYVN